MNKWITHLSPPEYVLFKHTGSEKIYETYTLDLQMLADKI